MADCTCGFGDVLCDSCQLEEYSKQVDELRKVLKDKIANLEYCEVSGCSKNKTAKDCRECHREVALKALGVEMCTDERMCSNCYSGQGECFNNQGEGVE